MEWVVVSTTTKGWTQTQLPLVCFGLPVQGHAKKAKTMQKHGPPQAPGAAGGAHLSTPCDPGQPKVSGSTHRVVSNRDHSFPKWIHSPSDVGTTKVPIHFTQDDHHSRDVEHGHPPPHKVFTTITEGETITRCPHWFPDSCSYRRRTTKKGVVELSHLFSDPSPNGAQLEPWIRSLLWPDCTLSPLSPKVESGPVGDPVVSDPMYPRGIHLSCDRPLTLLGRNRRSCPPRA